ncbi:MAG: hypothetical protein U0X41_00515 [Chitinophagales bacterium]|mgnify:FL=1
MSAIKSILLCRCPKCHKGKIFIDQNPYHLSRLSEMEKRCPVCDFDLENETGFHFLSMYMSYIVSMGLSFSFLIPLTIILGLDWIPKLLIMNAIILLVLWPFIFRWSRMISLWATVKWKFE